MWDNRYTVRVEEILSSPTALGLQQGNWFETQQRWHDNWQTSEQWWQDLEQNNEITAVNYTRNLLQDGERYLVFITPSYSDWSSQFNFFWESAAKINDDGTITPIRNVVDDSNVFDEYEGYTVDRLAELVYFANTWHEKYSD